MSTENPPTDGPPEPRQTPIDQTASPTSAKPLDCTAHDQDDVAACPEVAPHSKGRALFGRVIRTVRLFLLVLRRTDRVEWIVDLVMDLVDLVMDLVDLVMDLVMDLVDLVAVASAGVPF